MGVQIAGNILVQANGGPLPISQGGTGQTTAPAAINALLPVQTGNSGKVLTTNGTNVSWSSNPAGSPGGADTQIQFNDSGTFGGSANLKINKSTGSVMCAGTFTGTGINITDNNGTFRTIKFQTGGSNRWLLQTNATIEATSSVGSDFEFVRVADNGATSNQVFTVARNTGVVDFKVTPTINSIEVGYLNIPYTTVFDSSSRGKRIVVTNGFTVPAGTYNAGDAFSFFNNSSLPITITQGAGLTMHQDGTINTGNRSLLAYGCCLVWFLTSTECVVSGSVT